MEETDSGSDTRTFFGIIIHFVATAVFIVSPISMEGADLQPFDKSVGKITIKTRYADIITVSDPGKIALARDLLNSNLHGWGTPWTGAPVAPTTLQFYDKNEELLWVFGVSAGFLTTTVVGVDPNGKSIYHFYSKILPNKRIREFAEAFSPALTEAMYPVFPDAPEEKEAFSYWKSKLDDLKSGDKVNVIDEFIKKNNITVSAFADNSVGPGYFINLNLYTVNDGIYVDTIIKAQLMMNSDKSLSKVRFFGYKLANKSVDEKISQDYETFVQK